MNIVGRSTGGNFKSDSLHGGHDYAKQLSDRTLLTLDMFKSQNCLILYREES
jgi:hypothetical protein